MDQDFLNKLNDIIDANVGNSSFGAKELSRQVGMSQSSLLRRLRSENGKSINQYIRETRLKRALTILQLENVTVSEVTFRLGFSSPSYFTACFKKYFGYLPGEIKKNDGNGQAFNVSEANDPLKNNRKSKILIATVISLILILTAFLTLPEIIKNTRAEIKSVAVLPFKFMGDDSTKQYLAEGMRLAIQQKLGGIRDLRVIPWTTMEQYRNSVKTLKVIGRELKVDYVVEGFLKMEGGNHNHLIILNDVNKERQLFSKNYIQELTDVFNVQNQVTKDIAAEIRVVVTPEGNLVIERPPTYDLTAYDYYLLGNEHARKTYSYKERQIAIEMFENAVQKDSNFVLAWVGLAAGYRYNYHQKSMYSNNLENMFLAKKYLDKARSISPALKEVKFEEALYYYQCMFDIPKALGILQDMKTEYPYDAEIYAWLGYIYNRGTKEFEKSIEYLKHADSLNPAYWEYSYVIATILHFNRLSESKNAEDYYLKALDLAPSFSMTYRISNYYYEIGELNKAIEIIRTHEELFDQNWLTYFNACHEFIKRNFDRAIKMTDSIPEGEPLGFFTKHSLLGDIYLCIHDSAKAIYHYGLDLDFLLNKLKEAPEDYRLYRGLRSDYAGLRMKDQAMEADRKIKNIFAGQGQNSLIVSHENDILRIQTFVVLGEYNLAMEELDSLMQQKSHRYIEDLKYDPVWDVVRNHPKFKEIISNPQYQLNF